MIDYYEALSGQNRNRFREYPPVCTGRRFSWKHLRRKSKRYQTNREFYQCNQHLEFIRSILPSWELRLWRTASLGSYISAGSRVVGKSYQSCATLYVLILKLIYDEQMSSVSTS